ncbi:ATP-dependent dethiobiotin synthetase BioD [Hoyosella sp. G463]|uniref:ATP-dependent dethiobiotin synthetase BioD n=1 Tax=Lolliginicoccus lacisalsi TaxID=2742202 RepID=A0A927JEB7_9ACTN|nr:dethiobiotin synthase [Lolliginicoccus lacisalsi]MBD8507788.1 ATP-dependent dethiobiotin synthetase BioD [Lolliginicoccus lacisalsi]
MSVLLITGTSTEVGKTAATAVLAAIALGSGASVAVCKPAQTGIDDGEPGDLAEIERRVPGIHAVELARYPEPLAPLTAARRSSRPALRLAELLESVRELEARHDLVLVEGAGGVLVQLGADGFTLRDVARELAAPVVIVAAAGLGTLNHTALTAEALRHEEVAIAGIVIGAWPAEPDLAMRCNRTDLSAVTGVPVVGVIPAGMPLAERDTFTSAARHWIEPRFQDFYLHRRDT